MSGSDRREEFNMRLDAARKDQRQRSSNEAVRKRSGEVCGDDPLVAVLYTLMRDHVPAGTVEALVSDVDGVPGPYVYTNGWLAKYAEDLAARLRHASLDAVIGHVGECVKCGDCSELDAVLS